MFSKGVFLLFVFPFLRDLCFVHPIFRSWLLLATKLRKYGNITYSLFTFCIARGAGWKKKRKENYTMKVTKTKIQTKIWVERYKNIMFEMIRPCFLPPMDRLITMDLACVPSIYRVVLAWMEEFARDLRRISCITVGFRSPIFSKATMIFICFTVVWKKV